jgi:hypothetical protein
MGYRRMLVRAGLILGLAVGLGVWSDRAPARAAVENIGFPDFSYSGLSAPTGEKPQSKLWYHDGRWWADMLHTDGRHYIFYLDRTTQRWVRTTTRLDPRTKTKSDCLWDGAHLYIASGGGLESTGADLDAVLYRYRYDSASKTYARDFGPITIRPGGAETIVVDKDTTGRLWATYAQAGKIYVAHSLDSDQRWADPFPLPAAGANINISADDIATLVAFGGKIGVLWSNQLDHTFYFAVHQDGAAASAWTGGIVLRQANIADDHISLKSVRGDTSGRIFAAVKTSLAGAAASTPRILLLARQPDGRWQHTMVSSAADHQTRPLLLLDSNQRRLYVFSADEGGGAIYMKQSAMDTPQFPAGKGTLFISNSTYTNIDNATTTKQHVNQSTGVVVLASDDIRRRYLHNVINYGAPAPGQHSVYLSIVRR